MYIIRSIAANAAHRASGDVLGEEVTVQKHREYVAGQLRIYARWLLETAEKMEQPQIVAPKNEEMGE